MKKIIKFTLCIALTLAVVLAPTTVMAAKNYSESSQKLAVGSLEYNMKTGYDYTVFTFSPKEVGWYKITSENLLGLVGYNWVNFDPSDSSVNSNEYEWECTAVGQSIILAVKSTGADKATINVVLESKEVEVPIERTKYEAKANISPFVFDGDANLLEYVEAFDDVVDNAVLAEDGFYHLNESNGPILYVNLYDTDFMNLYDATSYGRLVATVFEGEKHIATNDYNDTFIAYYNAADKDTGLYPLTIDLIEIYQKVGSDINNHWYGSDGMITDSNEQDGWMFSCMYVVATDDNDGNSDGDGDNNGGSGGAGTGGLGNNTGNQQGSGGTNNTTGNGQNTGGSNTGNGTTNQDNDTNGGGNTTNGNGTGESNGNAINNGADGTLNGNMTNGNTTTNGDKAPTSPETSDSFSGIYILLVFGALFIITAKKIA